MTCPVSRQLCPEVHSGYGAVRSAVHDSSVVVPSFPSSNARGDRVPRPPEVEVVLVVPAIDRRIGPTHVLQREESRRVGGAEIVPCDELSGDFVPAKDRCALPPPGDVCLGVSPDHAVALPRSLTSLNSIAHCALSSAGGGALRNCDELWMRNGFTSPAHGVGSRIGSIHRIEKRHPVSDDAGSAPTETARTARRRPSSRAWPRPPGAQWRRPAS